MTSLIQDLRSAPEGTRELSDRVLLAMGWEKQLNVGHNFIWKSSSGRDKNPETRPDPSRSLDDVTALGDTKCRWSSTSPYWTSAAIASYGPKGGPALMGLGATEALARCAALLEAKGKDDA